MHTTVIKKKRKKNNKIKKHNPKIRLLELFIWLVIADELPVPEGLNCQRAPASVGHSLRSTPTDGHRSAVLGLR